MCVESDDPRAKSNHPEHRVWWLERRHEEMCARIASMNDYANRVDSAARVLARAVMRLGAAHEDEALWLRIEEVARAILAGIKPREFSLRLLDAGGSE